MEEMIFFVILTSIIVIAFNLFAMESSDWMSLQTIVGIGTLSCLLPLDFVYCFCSEMVAACLYEIGDIFYDSAWYRLPVKYQRLTILPIQRAGREMQFKCLGLVECSLAMFATVWNSQKYQ